MATVQALQINQLVITAFYPDQFLVGSAFDNLPLVENIDDIGLLNRTQTMCDGDRGSALSRSIQCSLDNLFGLGIESRGGFIQKKHSGIPDQGACDRHTLLLTSGQHASFATNNGIETLTGMVVSAKSFPENKGLNLRQGHDKVINVGILASLHKLLLRHIFADSQQNVLLDSALVQGGFLTDERQETAV